MLPTPFTCCSIGVATDCSTTSAAAPWYVVSTRYVGGDSTEYCSIDSRRSTARPRSVMTIAATMATIGRRMMNAAITPRRIDIRCQRLLTPSGAGTEHCAYAIAGACATCGGREGGGRGRRDD